jgi:DNA helicase-2/ATP-dependent DNA helicase PcrA
MPAMPAHVLDGLDPEQRLVAETLRGPVLVHAGAGTGKTRAITHRIAHAVLSGQHAASNGLAVTFTNRAAGEMRGRLAQLGVPSVAVRTFHAAALSQLRYFWPTVVGGPFPELVASKVGLVGQACRSAGLQASRALVRDLAAEIEWAGSSLVSAGEYVEAAQAAGRTPLGAGADIVDLPEVARVMSAYQDVKERANAIDFEDVLLSMIAMIGDRPDVADEIRRHYRWFTVDEYQDITPAQEHLLAGWLGDRDDVCVVGDASQTIYSFAGADPDSMARFSRRWPNATEIRLDRCYRCTPQIVTVANSVVRAGAKEAAGQGARHLEPVLLRSQREPGPAPDLVTCADDVDEATTVAARIGELVASGQQAHRDIAILIRTNAASEPLEVALAEAGIPYVMRGVERFFDRAEVREAIVRLRGQAAVGGRGQSQEDPAGPSSGARPVGGAAPGGATTAGPPGLAALPLAAGGGPLVAETIAVLASMGWEPGGPASGGATRERWESLAAVVALAGEVEATGRTTLAQLVAEFERRAQMAHAPTADGVTVATLHAAKGLEWPVVFLVGCAEGNLPIVYADTPARIAEERRLFYVGLTRAKDRLVVTWAMTRTGAGRQREPSRFLAEMRARGEVSWGTTAAGVVRQGRSAGSKERRRRPPGRCRVCGKGLVTAPERTLGRCSSCPGTADDALVERLRAWRLATAKERSVPAYVVFTDVTLVAVAERQPRTEAELLDIPGIGPAKVEQYGAALLAMVGAAEVPEPAPDPRSGPAEQGGDGLPEPGDGIVDPVADDGAAGDTFPSEPVDLTDPVVDVRS